MTSGVEKGVAPGLPMARHQPTTHEREVMQKLIADHKEKPTPPRVKVTNTKDRCEVSIDHPDPAIGQALLMKALGTTRSEFLDGLLGQIGNAASQGRTLDERGFNYMLAMVAGIEPRDEVEAMLAAQMAAVHSAVMTFARRLGNVENIPQQDSAERAFNKLARTFTTQMEALKRYRTGGEQRVTVEHVTVNEGGQAIVGAVVGTPGGGGSSKK